MRIEVLKQLLDACHLAKKSIETMPKLPKGMKPRHVHVMDVIGEMEDSKGFCRVGDGQCENGNYDAKHHETDSGTGTIRNGREVS